MLLSEVHKRAYHLEVVPSGLQAIKKEVDSAVEQAKQSSPPPPEMLWTNTYKDTLGVYTRGIDSRTKVKLCALPPLPL